jgi:DNA modification methylase
MPTTTKKRTKVNPKVGKAIDAGPISASKHTETHPKKIKESYKTKKGQMYWGTAEQFLESPFAKKYAGKVNLIFTSPPFPLNRKKKYGNKQGDAYVEWLSGLAKKFKLLLAPDGSIVMEMGNAWEPGEPVMSTLALKALIKFTEAGELNLCQQFICNNPARLPSPAQWVNVDRIRVKDSYTHVWWFAATPKPKANNRNVLIEYSDSMKQLLKTQKYNAGKRPSEFVIGEKSFLTNNQGAIPSNVLTIANTGSSENYQIYCREKGLPLHPARMPSKLAEFFIKFLTDKNDIVLDPFGGSNTTGAAAEALSRRWIAIEPQQGYIKGSSARFKVKKKETQKKKIKAKAKINSGSIGKVKK